MLKEQLRVPRGRCDRERQRHPSWCEKDASGEPLGDRQMTCRINQPGVRAGLYGTCDA
jgi:hypothetical protein